MKNINTITINGREFELCKDLSVTYNDVYGDYRYDYNDIYQAYDKPSYSKVAIWNKWDDWFMSVCREVGCDAHWWISSRNCFKFTITGKVKIGGDYYKLVITADHNRAYKLIG